MDRATIAKSIEEVVANNRHISDVAKEVGVSRNTLSTWIKKHYLAPIERDFITLKSKIT